MKKRTSFIMAAVLALIVLTLVIFSVSRSAPQDDMMDMLNRIENALGDEWKKQTVTEVFDWRYIDDDGNTITYHVCVTTYYGAKASGIVGLNTDAIAAVINPIEAESCQECTVSGLPAAIYQKDGRAYLCWTILPELSCVMEYDPNVESDEDMLRAAESGPANADHFNKS